MTHQEIAAEIEALNNAADVCRKAIDEGQREKMAAIRAKCGAIGHIFVWRLTAIYFGGEKQDSYVCAVCGAPRVAAVKIAA